MIDSWVYASLFNTATNVRFNIMANVMLTGSRLAQISVKISDQDISWLVEIKDQPGLTKLLGSKSSPVKECFDLTFPPT